jgi:hypothetical protein
VATIPTTSMPSMPNSASTRSTRPGAASGGRRWSPTTPRGWRAPGLCQVQVPSGRRAESSMSIRRAMSPLRYLDCSGGENRGARRLFSRPASYPVTVSLLAKSPRQASGTDPGIGAAREIRRGGSVPWQRKRTWVAGYPSCPRAFPTAGGGQRQILTQDPVALIHQEAQPLECRRLQRWSPGRRTLTACRHWARRRGSAHQVRLTLSHRRLYRKGHR